MSFINFISNIPLISYITSTKYHSKQNNFIYATLNKSNKIIYYHTCDFMQVLSALINYSLDSSLLFTFLFCFFYFIHFGIKASVRSASKLHGLENLLNWCNWKEK